MNAAHTPGPWTFSKYEDYGDTRFYIAQNDDAPFTPNYSDVATLIAETVSAEYVAIQEANAHLIAAAPDLLAALQLILPLAKGYAYQHQVGSNQAYCEQAELAIAKAVQA